MYETNSQEALPVVLLVDDDPTFRTLARATLEQAGYAVTEVEDGVIALEVFDDVRPDLVLLDVNLPQVDGFTVCARLRRRCTGRHTPVLMVTGLEDDIAQDRAYEAGATDFITKPLHWRSLNYRVRYLIRASRAMDDLRLSEARLAQAQRIARLGNWELNLSTQTFRCSPEVYRLFGLAPEGRCATRAELMRLVYPPDRERANLFFHTAVIEQQAYSLDYRVIPPHGPERVLHEQAEIVRDETGRALWLAGTIQDITERKRLEAQLHQSQKMEAIGTLAGGIAHDFNNLLFAMIGYTEEAMYSIPPHTDAWKALQEVCTAGNRAKQLIQQILTFSRKSDPHRVPVQLRELITEALSLLRGSLPSSIDIQQEIAADAGAVLADPTQIHQVLINLFTNAEHAMREAGGILEVGLAAVEVDQRLTAQYPELKPGSYVRLTVRDTGHGMPPDIQARIFEPFFTTKGAGVGTGMGLSMAYGIIAGYEGAITVDSVQGQGTTFRIYLPQISQTAEAAGPAQVFSLPGQEAILLIEDEEAIVRLEQAILERLGYTVVGYTDSRDALAAFQAAPERFDLVITDQTMPHMTGDVLAAELRRIRPDLPIILCTGFSHTVDAARAEALGFAAFLQKPLSAHELTQAIRQVVEERSDSYRDDFCGVADRCGR